MFVVYKLFFKSSDRVYIGKTYDINKRITDHLYSVNVLKEKTLKGNWMRKHLKISKLEYEILFRADTEQEAYDKELYFIKRFIVLGKPIVNTQRKVQAGYTKGSVRILSEEEKLRRNLVFGKDHVIIGQSGDVYYTNCLRKWAIDNSLSYRNLHSCVKGKSKTSQGYKVFYKEDWDSMSDGEREEVIQVHKVYDQFKTKESLKYRESLKKEFWILNKNGDVEHGNGITEYCQLMGYNSGNIINTHRNRTPMYGKILFYDINDLHKFKKEEFYKFYNVLDNEDKKRIFEELSKTKKYSHVRGKITKELAEKYHCSSRRIIDTYKNYIKNGDKNN